jgi:hypothetical protein
MANTQGRIGRREFLVRAVLTASVPVAAKGPSESLTLAAPRKVSSRLGDETLKRDWLARWEKNILQDARNRYCDREMGEEIGWLISPFLNGFYYGHLATQDSKWVDMLMDWADAWLKRRIKEPDGYVGWPKADGASTRVVPDLYTDNLLGEAMGLRPVVLMAAAILKTPPLRKKHGRKAEEYVQLAEQVFEKWDRRGCWREVKEGGVWVVPPFGIDRTTGKWTEGYERRTTDGFTKPANKQNLIALWLLAMRDATGNCRYQERAEKWWRVMKSRMRNSQDGRYFVWDYWDPAGPWDYKPDGAPKHWVGVHPNGGYYAVDVEGIVAACQRGLVFSKEDLARLIATNRDFMWNQQVQGAKFGRIDGGRPDQRWAKSAGVLWTALVPCDKTLRAVFEANHNPESWGGLSTTPWYLSLESGQGAL